MNPAQPGDLLAGRYRLRSIIGRGGMGIVWLATDEYLDREVAIKEAVRPPELDDRDWAAARRRSLREARTAARLSHFNIVGVYDVVEHDSRPWIVLQYAPYPSLSDVIRNAGPLPADEAVHLGLRVVSALRAAHAAGVIHRDVKPSNVLLGPDGRVVLTDFGLAVIDTGPVMSVTGQIVGSPAYMAPERARGERATPAADLWSLGATLYAAAEGRAPFQRSSTMAVLTAVATEEVDPPELAGPLWPVISGLLRKDPNARLTADQAEEMLRDLARDADPAEAGSALMPGRADDVGAGRTRLLSAAEPGPRRGRRLTGLAAALLVATAIALFALLVLANSAGQQANARPGSGGSTFPVQKSPTPGAISPASTGPSPGGRQTKIPPGHRKHHKHGGDDGTDGNSQD